MRLRNALLAIALATAAASTPSAVRAFARIRLPRRARRPEVVLAMSQFDITFDNAGRKLYTPGDAKVWILSPEHKWTCAAITDPDSNVVHKALPYDVDGDGRNELVVVSGSRASIKFYRFRDGKWSSETVWQPKLLRVRDIEFGDVDGDGQTEFVVATHDRGGVYVFNKVLGKWVPRQIHGTDYPCYVHEIEIGDVDGDGIQEIFANPSKPNVDVGVVQSGKVVMFKWNGQGFDTTVIDDMTDTHAKEILVADIYGNGRPVLVVPEEGVGRRFSDGRHELVRPAQLREFRWVNGEIKDRVIAEIPDFQIRSLWVGDADNDSVLDIVAGAKLAGLYILKRQGIMWKAHLIDAESQSAVHAVAIVDLDGDGKNEILSAADYDGRLDRYRFTGSEWEKATVVDLPQGDWVWTIYQGDVDGR